VQRPVRQDGIRGRHRPYEGQQLGERRGLREWVPGRHRPYEGQQPEHGDGAGAELVVIIAPARGSYVTAAGYLVKVTQDGL
jgi:hypothetical protein